MARAAAVDAVRPFTGSRRSGTKHAVRPFLIAMAGTTVPAVNEFPLLSVVSENAALEADDAIKPASATDFFRLAADTSTRRRPHPS